MIFRLNALLIILLFPFSICSAPKNLSYSKYKFQAVPNKEAKTAGHFKDVVKDNDGYIWIGTWGKLLRYDGYKFESYRKTKTSSSPELVDEAVTALAYSQDIGLWIGSVYALTNYKNQTFTPIVRTDERAVKYINDESLISQYGGLPDEPVSSIHIASNNDLWMGMRDSFVHFDRSNKKFTPYSPWSKIRSKDKSGLQLSNVAPEDILEDEDGVFWLATVLRGLIRFDSKNNSARVFEGQLTDDIFLEKVSAVTKKDKNTILLATNDGLLQFDINNEQLSRYPVGNPIREPLTSLFHSPSNLWVAGQNVYHINKDNEVIKYDQALDFGITEKDTRVGNLYIDKQDTIYVFYNNHGIYRASPYSSKVRIINDIKNTDNNVKVLTKTSDNIFWAGFSKGLIRGTLSKNKLKYESFHHQDGRDFTGIRDIHLGRNENIWIAEKDTISVIKKNGSEQSFQIPANLIDDKYIHSLVEDYKGNVWFTVRRRGIFKLDPNTNIISKEPAFSNQQLPLWMHIKLFLSDDRKILTYFKSSDGLGEFHIKRGKLNRVFKEKKIKYPNEFPLPFRESSVWNFSRENGNGVIWATHAENYISWFDVTSGTGKTIDVPVDEPVFAVAVGKEKNSFWLTGENGSISYWNRNVGSHISFNSLAGVPESGVGSASIVLANGIAIFGSHEGLSVISPGYFRNNPHSSDTTISEISVNHQKIQKEMLDFNGTIQLTLKHFENILTFSFFGNSSAVPNNIKYKYRLKGIYDQWRETEQNERKALFTNLNPGDYIFEVQSTNNDGLWGDIQKVYINIKPSLWQTTWAYFTYLVIFVLSLTIIMRYRTKALESRALALELTIRKRTQELTEEKQKVEKLLTQKTEEFANVSHEFRTPLTLILGPLSQLMKNNKQPEDIKRLNVIQRNGYRLLRMVDQLLNLETFRAKQTVQQIPINTSQIIKNLTEAFTDLASDKGIKINVKHLAEASFEFTADAFEKIVLNLLSNAVKYTKSNGTIDIETNRDNNHVILKVSDTGIGIPNDKLDDIFERFNRVLDKNSEQITGAGIGLALVKSLVESHQGSIEIQSELNKGTCVTVSLPIINEVDAKQIDTTFNNDIIEMEIVSLTEQTKQINEQQKPEIAKQENHQQTILVIEDNQDMQDYIVGSLGDDYRAITASNGEEGVKLAKQEVPDLIISDIMMPKKDGFETTKELRSNDITSHIPIILLTALGDSENRIKGWHEKADEYLTKPFNTEELNTRIENLLEIRNILKRRFGETVFEQKESSSEIKSDIRNEISIAEKNKNQIQQDFIYQFNEQLEKNYSDASVSIGNLASELSMSERQFFRKLKGIVDMTPREYLRRYRLEKAKEQLKKGESATNTAFDVGFSSQSYFAKCFKAQYGMSPTEYMNRN